MFLEKYEKFKINNKIESSTKNNFYEVNSIKNEQLFSLEEFFTREYYNNKGTVDINFFTEILKENKLTLNKADFLICFLENYKKILTEQIFKLDLEYFEMNNSQSFIGSSFLNMANNYSEFSNVLIEEILYKRNINISENFILRSNNSTNESLFTIKKKNNNSFFIELKEQAIITDMVIELHKNASYSIYGVAEDNKIAALFKNVKSSENNTFVLTEENVYSKIFITSDLEIFSSLKNIKIFTKNKDNVELSNGYLIRAYTTKGNKSGIFISDSFSKLYRVKNEEEVKLFIEMINSGSPEKINSILNSHNEIGKNININLEEETSIYIIEVFPKEVNKFDRLHFFGKEDK